MTSPTQSPSQKPVGSPPLNLEVGRMVRTPAGNFAAVVGIFAVLDGKQEHIEVLVQYPEGERARFRAAHLRPMP